MMKLKEVWKKESNRNAVGCGLPMSFGFLRLGEAVSPAKRSFDPQYHLCFKDICINSHTAPAWTRVTIKASKTDPFRQWVTLHLGKTGSALCPVMATL